MSNTATKTGTVKHFKEDKGYGFIKQDGSKEDLFFHISKVNYENVEEGDKVSYEIEKGKKGDNAINVTSI